MFSGLVLKPRLLPTPSTEANRLSRTNGVKEFGGAQAAPRKSAQLRVKKISESILDEFPGIGERRKAALLKKFGSVQRLRMASLEDIAAVPGFGGKAAGELKVFLEARSGELLTQATQEHPSVKPGTIEGD